MVNRGIALANAHCNNNVKDYIKYCIREVGQNCNTEQRDYVTRFGTSRNGSKNMLFSRRLPVAKNVLRIRRMPILVDAGCKYKRIFDDSLLRHIFVGIFPLQYSM